MAVCLHPYWVDNEAEEFVPMKGRWIWAMLYASFFQILLSPALWGMSWVLSRKRRALPGTERD